MNCKACKKLIDDDSIYCKWCGERQIRERKKKPEISVPKPRQLKSGQWYAQLMLDGEVHYVKADTEAGYYARARALKAGMLSPDKRSSRLTLREVLRSYIDNNKNVLSPATIRGYEIIYRNRFLRFQDKLISAIDYQAMVNEEARRLAPKTVVNSWGLVSAALAAVDYPVPNINRPSLPASEEDWLDYEQIKVFLDAVKGSRVEAAALLALHGLRLSELLDLDASQIKDDTILVRGATVMDENNKLVHKDTNKNRSSSRSVPVLIPRLLEVLPPKGKAVALHPSSIRRGLEKVCREAGLPVCSAHDLRRSFASLAYHLKWNSQTTMVVGGWSNLQTVEKVYRKLASREKNEDVLRMLAYYTA